MVEDNNTGSAAAVAGTDSSLRTPATKKRRVPQRRKTAAQSVGAQSKETIAKAAPVKRRKRGEKDGAAKLDSVETKVAAAIRRPKTVIKGAGGKKPVKQAGRRGNRPGGAIEEMADLIQLEEENKRLRKTLADKLRQENADLRKRLGLD